jgi:Mrp family chromosome partitioning ATPase
MAKRIYLVGGSKGGVGKSLVSMAVLDHLQAGGTSGFEVSESICKTFSARSCNARDVA